jgi:hypothetical protein
MPNEKILKRFEPIEQLIYMPFEAAIHWAELTDNN